MNIAVYVSHVTLAAAIFVAYYVPLTTYVDTSQGTFKQGDDTDVYNAWQHLWWGISGAWALYFLATGIQLNLGEALQWIPFIMVHAVTLYVLIGATATISGHAHIISPPLFKYVLCTSFSNPNAWMKTSPIPDQAYRGKLLVNFFYDYEGAAIVSPGAATWELIHPNQPIEVAHARDPERNAQGQAWFYIAKGTGVFASFKNIATAATHLQVAHMFGSTCESYECPKGLTTAFRNAAKQGYDAVQITHHMDQMCHNIAIELIAIGKEINGHSSCPIPFANKFGERCPCNASMPVANCGHALNRSKQPSAWIDAPFQIMLFAAALGGCTAVPVFKFFGNRQIYCCLFNRI